MKQGDTFRYDPLYRVIDETEEMRLVEGKLRNLFDRLKRIGNLGIIPEIFEMARYPKYEHAIGVAYQINELLDIADTQTIPKKYHKPLKLASLFLHLGHLPFSYSTERALLLTANLGDRAKENRIRKYIRDKVDRVSVKSGVEEERKQKILEKLFSLEDYGLLHRYFSGDILLKSWKSLKSILPGADEAELEVTITNITDPTSDGYRYLALADEADFVQRDALYFGSVRIDISPAHLYRDISRYRPTFSVSEHRLIQANRSYLTERFYENPDVVWFSRIYEKIVSALIRTSNFRLEWLETYDDAQLRRLITENLCTDNRVAYLPTVWVDRAKSLFDKRLRFSEIVRLEGIWYPAKYDSISIEYGLSGKTESETGLLRYPFEAGLLIDVAYTEKKPFPAPPDLRQVNVGIFRDLGRKSLLQVLQVAKNLSSRLSITNVEVLRLSLARLLAWTNEASIPSFGRYPVLEAIAESVKRLENGGASTRGFMSRFLDDISGIKAYANLWQDYENQVIWKGMLNQLLREQKTPYSPLVYAVFCRGLLCLPVRLLQYQCTRPYLDAIHQDLVTNITSERSRDKQGQMFEALCLIHRLRQKQGEFQFLIPGLTIIDPSKAPHQREENEFDIVELSIAPGDRPHCCICACSIAQDYADKNKGSLSNLADHLHAQFHDLVIRTRYLIPTDTKAGKWMPNEEDVGRNYG